MKNKTYVIAEIGLNHDGNLDQALLMIEKSKEAGADAVKFQNIKVDKLLNPLIFNKGKTEENWVFNALKKVEIDDAFLKAAKNKCDALSIDLISSPFDEESLVLVAKYCAKIKIASSEVTNLPFLSKIGAYQKPVILSTGISTLGEIEEAISALVSGGVTDLSILHCVSLYPLEAADANLRMIQTLRQCFNLPTGFSDHSLDETFVFAAVALGSEIIEKHVTLKRENRIFDHAHSMEFKDFKNMINKIRIIEEALGDGIKKISAKEMDIKIGSSRSFFACVDLKAGNILTELNTKAVRPLIGIPVKAQGQIMGKRLKRDIVANFPIFWEDIDW